jgi:ferric-dicitrate binding protein FerR (iron transport regulator)
MKTPGRGRPDVDAQARAWLLHLLSGKATAGDGRAFRQWCARDPRHARAFAHAHFLWEQLARPARSLGSRRTESSGS